MPNETDITHRNDRFPPLSMGTWGIYRIPICRMVHPLYPGLNIYSMFCQIAILLVICFRILNVFHRLCVTLYEAMCCVCTNLKG
jgi:hypothetical protein